MNFRKRFINQLSNIGQAYTRYPLTMLLFILLAIINAIQITGDMNNYERLVHGFLVAILLSMVASHLNERFIVDRKKQWAVLIGSVLLSIVYYLLLPPNDASYLVYEVRTAVLVFALFIAFIWVPSIKNKVTYFYQYFLVAFKYGFTTILYGLVLTLGLQAIISSIDYLLFAVDYDYFIHAANLVWFIFVPSYFLSLVPVTIYFDADEKLIQIDHEKDLSKDEAFGVTKFLKILITYILVPLIGVYTFILVAYILLNIGGEFWSDNLLEPMLISYTIVVILVYLLACNLNEPVVQYFRKIFPKILILIVSFQLIASVLKIRELGVTHGRYYVIVFGVFSLVTGFVFSFLSREKTGWIVPFLVGLAIISVIPPMDAFTVGKNSQQSILTDTLIENEMLSGDQVQANAAINQTDKERITRSVDYLYYLGYLDEVAYLPEDFDLYDDFTDVFGFQMVYEDSGPQDELNQYASLDRTSTDPMVITEEDYFFEIYLSNYEEEIDTTIVEINEDYTFEAKNSLPYFELQINNGDMGEPLEIDLEPLFIQGFAATTFGNEMVTNEEEMTLIVENEKLRVRIVALELMKNEDNSTQSISAQLYVFVDVKTP